MKCIFLLIETVKSCIFSPFFCSIQNLRLQFPQQFSISVIFTGLQNQCQSGFFNHQSTLKKTKTNSQRGESKASCSQNKTWQIPTNYDHPSEGAESHTSFSEGTLSKQPGRQCHMTPREAVQVLRFLNQPIQLSPISVTEKGNPGQKNMAVITVRLTKVFHLF